MEGVFEGFFELCVRSDDISDIIGKSVYDMVSKTETKLDAVRAMPTLLSYSETHTTLLAIVPGRPYLLNTLLKSKFMFCLGGR